VLLCIGTIEPRKAQIPLAQAFDLIAERHPRAELVFVGGRDDYESDALKSYIESSAASERIKLIPITPDVQEWYGLSDFLVCASDVESLPRTVLEAMAWETPVLATEVFGLPELIEDGVTGWLCEPRDTIKLAAALDRVLTIGAKERRQVGAASRALVERRHSLSAYTDQVASLLDQVMESPDQPSSNVATS
jgi:D-inositol-3-phosphate glycosyltransferase